MGVTQEHADRIGKAVRDAVIAFQGATRGLSDDERRMVLHLLYEFFGAK